MKRRNIQRWQLRAIIRTDEETALLEKHTIAPSAKNAY
jgi:hypothetical protein